MIVKDESKLKTSMEFFKNCLTDEVMEKADFTTLTAYDDDFIDGDYHIFLYGILHSIVIDGKFTYIYVLVKIGDDISESFRESIIDEAIERIKTWHKEKNAVDDEPYIEKVIFQAGRKGQLQ